MKNKKIILFVIVLVILIVVLSFLKNKGHEETKEYCLPDSRNIDVCIEIYSPVCGWFDSEKVQCIKYPCAETYSNSCFACQNENVIYYTEGECPS